MSAITTNSLLNINTFPIDVLSQIIDRECPSVVEQVCQRWKEASRNRRHLECFRIPSDVLPRYPFLTSLDGLVDGLTDYVLESKIGDLAVYVKSITLDEFIHAYDSGKHKYLEINACEGDFRFISFDGLQLKVQIDSDNHYKYREWTSMVNLIAFNQILNHTISHFDDETKADAKLRIDIGRFANVDLKPLTKVKWGKINLDIMCIGAFPSALPMIEIGRLRMSARTLGPISLCSLACNMKRMLFDSGELQCSNHEAPVDSILGIKLIKGSVLN